MDSEAQAQDSSTDLGSTSPRRSRIPARQRKGIFDDSSSSSSDHLGIDVPDKISFEYEASSFEESSEDESLSKPARILFRRTSPLECSERSLGPRPPNKTSSYEDSSSEHSDNPPCSSPRYMPEGPLKNSDEENAGNQSQGDEHILLLGPATPLQHAALGQTRLGVSAMKSQKILPPIRKGLGTSVQTSTLSAMKPVVSTAKGNNVPCKKMGKKMQELKQLERSNEKATISDVGMHIPSKLGDTEATTVTSVTKTVKTLPHSETKVSDCEDKLQSKDEEISFLKQKIDNYRNELADMKIDVDFLKMEKQEYTKTIRAFEKGQLKHENNIYVLKNENKSLKSRIPELEETVATLNADITEYLNRIEELNTLEAEMESDNRQLRSSSDELVRLLRDLKDENIESLKRIEEITRIEETTKLDNRMLRSQIKEMETSLDTQRDIAALQSEIDTLEAVLDGQRKENTIYLKKNEVLVEKNRKTEQENGHFKTKIEELEQMLDAQKKDNTVKSKRIEQLTGIEEEKKIECETMKFEMEELKIAVASHQNQSAESLKKIEEVNGKEDEMKIENKNLMSKIEELETALDESLKMLTEKEQENETENSTFKSKIRELEKSLEDQRNQNMECAKKIQESAGIKEDKEMENAALKSNIIELEMSLEAHRKSNAESLKKNEELTALKRAKNIENRTLMSKIDGLETILATQRNENKNYIKKIQELTGWKEKMENENKDLKFKFEELETVLDNQRNKNTESPKTLEDLTAMEEQMSTETAPLKSEIETLKKLLDDQRDESKNCASKIEGLTRIKEEKENNNASLQSRIDELETRLWFENPRGHEDEMSNENIKLISQIAELEKALEMQKIENSECLKKIKDVDGIDRKEEEIATLRSTIEDLQRMLDAEKAENLGVAQINDDLTSVEKRNLSEFAAELRDLQESILDAIKELADDSEGKDVSSSTSSPLSVELSQADIEFTLDIGPQNQDPRFEIGALIRSVAASMEELREEISKSKARTEKSNSSSSNAMDQDNNVEHHALLEDKINILHERLESEELRNKTLELTVNEQKEQNEQQCALIENLRNDLSDSEKELERVISRKDSELHTIQHEFDTKSAQYDEQNSELQKLKDENKALNDSLLSARSDAASHGAKVSELEQYIADSEVENHRLLDELAQQRNAHHEILQSQEEQYQSMVDQLQSQVDDLNSENEGLQLQTNNLNIHEILSSLEQMKEEIQCKEFEMQEMAVQVKMLQEENKSMEMLVEEAKDYFPDYDVQQRNINSGGKIRSSMPESAPQGLSEELLGKIEFYDSLYHELKENDEDRISNDDRNPEGAKLESQLSNTIFFLESSICDLKDMVDDSQREIAVMAGKLDASEGKKSKNGKSNQAGSKEPTQVPHHCAAMDQLEKQGKSLQQASAALEKRNSQLKKCLAERNALQEEVTLWESKYSKLKMEFEQTKPSDSTSGNEQSDQIDFEKWCEKEKSLKQTIEELKERAHSLSEEKQGLLTQLEESKVSSTHKISEMEHKEIKWCEQKNELQQTINKLTERTHSLSEEKLDLLTQLEESKVSSTHKISEMEHQEIKWYEKRNDWYEQKNELQQTIEKLTERIQSLSEEKDGLSRQLEENTALSTKIVELEGRLSEQMTSEKKWFDQKKELQQTIEQLRERTLHLSADNEKLVNQLKDYKSSSKHKITEMENNLNEQAGSEKKWSEDVKDLENKIEVLTAQTLRVTTENEKLVQQLEESTTVSQSKIADLEQKLTDKTQSEKKFNRMVKEAEVLTGRIQGLEYENEQLLNQLKDSEYQLKYSKRSEKTLNKNALAMEEQIHKLRSQKCAFRRLFSKENKQLEEYVEKLEVDNETLQQNLQCSNRIVQETRNEAETAHGHSLAIEQEFRDQLTSWKENMSKLEADKLKTEADVRRLMESNRELEESVKQKELTEKQLREDIVQQQKENEDFRTKTKDNDVYSRQTLKQLRKQMRHLKDGLEDKENLTVELTQDVERLEKEFESKEQLLMVCRSSEKHLKRKLMSTKEDLLEIENAKLEAEERLKAELNSVSNDEKDLEQRLKKTEEVEKRLRYEMETKQEQLQNTIDVLKKQSANLENEKKYIIEENGLAMQALKNDLENERNKVRESFTKLEEQSRKTRDLEQEMNDRFLGERRQLDEKLRELAKSVTKLTEDLHKQNLEKSDLMAQLEESTSAIAKLSEEKCRLHCNNKSLKKKIASTIKDSMDTEFKKQATREDVFMREIEELKQHMSFFKDRKKDDEDEMKDKIRELQYKYQSAKNNVEDLQRHIRYRDDKEDKLKEEIEMLKNNVNDKEAVVRRAKDEAVTQCGSLKHRISELEHQLKGKEHKNQTLTDINQMLRNKLMYMNNGLMNGRSANVTEFQHTPCNFTVDSRLEISEQTARKLVSQWQEMLELRTTTTANKGDAVRQ